MKTRAKTTRGNTHFRDDDYSPVRGRSLWESCPQLAANDPAVAHVYFNDFYDFTSGEWTSTETEAGAGDTVISILDAAGGILSVANDVNDNDATELQKKGEAFKLAANKPLWFEARLSVSDADQCDLLVGLAITDTTAVAGNSDGVNFRLADGSAALSFVTEKNSTETTTAAVHTVADATMMRLGFFFDGAGTVYAYVNGVLVATHTANICDDEELCITFAHHNGDAGGETLLVDYVKVVQIR